MDIAILVVLGVLTVINLVIYHKLFKVYYFDLGKGILREIIVAGFVACIEIFLIFQVLGGALGIVGGVFTGIISLISSLLGILLPVALIGITVFGIKKVIESCAPVSTDTESITVFGIKKVIEYIKIKNGVFASKTESCLDEKMISEQSQGSSGNDSNRNEKENPRQNADNEKAAQRKKDVTDSSKHNTLSDEIFCTQCGQKIKRSSKFCNYCGKKNTYHA